MPNSKILHVYDNNNDEYPSLCVHDIHGNWIIYSNRDEGYSEIAISDHLPEEFQGGVSLNPQEVDDLNFNFLGTYTIDFLDILTGSGTSEEKISNFNNSLQMIKKLTDCGWKISETGNGELTLQTTLLYE